MNASLGKSAEHSSSYPRRYEASTRVRGTHIFFRPIKVTDAELLQELFRSHSKETIVHRYFGPLRELPPEQITRFVDLDYRNDMAIVGLVSHLGRQRMICVGRFFRDPTRSCAEIAITVHDDYQRRGIGTYLLHALIQVARDMKIEFLAADVMTDNQGMMRLLHKAGRRLTISLEAGIYHVEFSVHKSKDN